MNKKTSKTENSVQNQGFLKSNFNVATFCH